jgi:hypothetical protein
VVVSVARFNQPSQGSSRCPRFLSDIPSTRESFVRANASERLGWLSAWARAINICKAQRGCKGVVRGFLNSGSIYSGARIAAPRVVVSVDTFQSIIAGFIAAAAVSVSKERV